MTDEWTFRTTTGRATVADGRLRISGSLGRMAREHWREGWTRNAAGRRLLFLFSTLGSAWFLARAARSLRAALRGSADAVSLFVVGAVGLGALAVAYRATRTRTIPLQEIEAVRRAEEDRLEVEREGDRDAVTVETPTPADADEAVEMLRLRGVRVEDPTDAPVSRGFRKRLGKKAERET